VDIETQFMATGVGEGSNVTLSGSGELHFEPSSDTLVGADNVTLLLFGGDARKI
jgi:hypothetical protein